MIGRKRSSAGLVDRVGGRLAAGALGLEREVDHHDGVLLDDADQQNDADQGDHAELGAAEEQGEDGADAGGGQGGEDRDRVDVALVEDAEDDVDGDEGGEDQERLVGERRLERLRRALEAAADAGRQAGLARRRLDGADGVAERDPRRQVERQRHRRELRLVVDRERRRSVPRAA